MGIKNLNKFIKTKFPSAIIDIDLENLRFKKIAVDTSLYLYKYKALNGGEWIISFIDLICCLKELNIHPTFVFDGKPPAEKCLEKDKRSSARDKLENTIIELEIDYNEYINTGILSENLKKFYKEHSKNTRLLGKDKINDNLLEKLVNSKKNQLINVTKDDIILLKKVLNLMGINYITAVSEAEKTCAKLCIDNKVDAVLSEDTDLIPYGTPYILNKINIYNKTVKAIDFKVLLETINFTHEQMIDFCIMCGTDYNNNIPKIGNAGAFKLIEKHKNIDNIPDLENIELLKHNTVRNLFNNFDECDSPNIEYSKKPDFENLTNLFSLNNIDYPIIKIQKKFSSKIIF